MFVSNSSNGTEQDAKNIIDPTPFVLLTFEVIICLYSAIFVVAVVGNVLVIVTLSRCRRMRTVTNLFLLNLAIADLLLGVLCMPVTLIGQLKQNFIFGYTMCKLIPYFQAVSVSVSVWTLVSIALERYFAICRPLKSRSWQTRSHAYKTISVVWIVSLLICLPLCVLSELIPLKEGRHKCRESWEDEDLEKAYNLFLLGFFFVVPLVLVMIAYGMIASRLWEGLRNSTHGIGGRQDSVPELSQSETSSSCGRPVRVLYQAKSKAESPSTTVLHVNHLSSSSSQNESCLGSQSYCCGRPRKSTCTCSKRSSITQNFPDSKIVYLKRNKSQVGFHINQNGMRSTYTQRSVTAKKKVIVMLYVIVLEFFVCWTPLSVINAWGLMDETMYDKVNLNSIALIQLLAYISCCCNPITYGFMNVQFRTAFIAVFQCWPKRRRDSFLANRFNGTQLNGSGLDVLNRKELNSSFVRRKSTNGKDLKDVPSTHRSSMVRQKAMQL